MVTVQLVAVPEQSPLQPAKVEPVVASAVRVTLPVKLAEQVGPQLIPDGLLVTMPEPDLEIVNKKLEELSG